MASELIINASLPETRIALMENGEIQELLIERASGKGIVGNIYKGRVTRVLPGMQAAFVDIGLEKAAFLYVDDVYVHSEIWEEEEGSRPSLDLAELNPTEAQGELGSGSESGSSHLNSPVSSPVSSHEMEGSKISDTEPLKPVVIVPRSKPLGSENSTLSPLDAAPSDLESHSSPSGTPSIQDVPKVLSPQRIPDLPGVHDVHRESHSDLNEDPDDYDLDDEDDEEEEGDEGDEDGPVEMGPSDEDSSKDQPEGTLAPRAESAGSESNSPKKEDFVESSAENSGPAAQEASTNADQEGQNSENVDSDRQSQDSQGRRRHRRGRRGGRFRRRGQSSGGEVAATSASEATVVQPVQQKFPDNYREQMADSGKSDSDRSGLVEEQQQSKEAAEVSGEALTGRPENEPSVQGEREQKADHRADFKAPRSRDRRIRVKTVARPVRAQVNIQDLLKEGQEILVQVAKDPIATKGARLTCHISLPGRHLVCMPTIDHVGVSRRIERDDERRRLREYVERNRPRNLGFIVRTASGKQQSEKRIKQDIEYLTRLWTEIKEKAGTMTAPALVYEDLNSVLRAIRDWVTEEIDKVVVDSRYHFNEIQRFVSHFMPSLKQKVELYHGDIPIFDAYGISTELSRSLERKVWLKSGGYIVVDQAEALVAIDVNTGRYVGKKNLEDTILKTNLEAVQEIAYQLRLRNCGGIIILDLIDMEKDENKQRVYRALEEALAKDRARPTIMKISELGLVEMTRKRTRDTIIRTLCESCTHCEGKGFIKSKQTVAYEVMREVEREGIEREVSKILVQAHPDVIDILAIDERETLDQLERRYRKLVYLQAVTHFHPEQFEVTADKRERTDRGRDHQLSPQDRQPPDRQSQERQSQERQNDSSHERPYDRQRGRQRQSHSQQASHLAPSVSGPSLPIQNGHGNGSSGVIVNANVGSVSAELPQEGATKIPDSLKLGRVLVNSVPTSESRGDLAGGSAIRSDGQMDLNLPKMAVEGVGPVLVNKLKPVILPPSPNHSSSGQEKLPNGASDSSRDGSFDEEDRLAFLRAQAAQDAALARLANGNGNLALRSPNSRNLDELNGRNDRSGAGRRNTRGRRGGKFRPHDRAGDRVSQRPRGSKPYGLSQSPQGTPSPQNERESLEGGADLDENPSTHAANSASMGPASESVKARESVVATVVATVVAVVADESESAKSGSSESSDL